MRIIEKIQQIRQEILSDPTGAGAVRANELAEKARKAMFKGIESAEWLEYMKEFATTQEQLNRLTGKDDAFNKSEYGLQCLAYIASNSTCTIDTVNGGGTLRNMPVEMLISIDEGL